MTEDGKQADDLRYYRKLLVAAEQKSQESFDKTVLSLSGGALGISFAFLKDVIGPHQILQPCFLIAAWLAWGFSTFSVLISYYLSHLALRHAISQVDKNNIYTQRSGGAFAIWTAILNATGAVLFLVGVCLITVFVNFNISTKGATNDRKETPISTATPTITATPPTNPDKGQATSPDGGLHSPASTTPTPSKE